MHRFSSLCAIAAFALTVSSIRPALAAGVTSALQSGTNQGTADSFVGNHDWTFAANPGPFDLNVTLGRVATNALPGAPFTIVLHVVPLSNSKLKFTAKPGGYEVTGKILKPVKCRLTIVPPTSTLVREASEYTIDVTGSIVYTAGADPVIGSYTGPSGATRFLAGGVVKTIDGQTGTWSLFDPDTHIYSVTIGQNRYSVKLVTGQGLNDASNGNIVFQSVH